jgi:hypothetical protein
VTPEIASLLLNLEKTVASNSKRIAALQAQLDHLDARLRSR